MNEPRFEVYLQSRALIGERPDDRFGWRFRAANGQITAVGGEGFTRREDAHRAVRQFLVALADTGVDLSEAVPAPPILDVDE